MTENVESSFMLQFQGNVPGSSEANNRNHSKWIYAKVVSLIQHIITYILGAVSIR